MVNKNAVYLTLLFNNNFNIEYSFEYDIQIETAIYHATLNDVLHII